MNAQNPDRCETKRVGLTHLALLATLLVALTGCSTTKVHTEQNWMRTELFFGLSTRDGTPISAEQWRSFLDHNITPRFPDGFTVLSAEGRWRNARNRVQVEPSRLLIILYPPTNCASMNQRITGVTSEYIKQFNQSTVLRGDTRERVTFYTEPVDRSAPKTPGLQKP